MKPTLDRSDQVVAHVVAWHNRHPLALRISPDQVHSVGVVSLPYAVRGAVVQPAATVPLVPDPAAPAPLPDAQPAPEAPDAPDAETEVAIEAVVEFAPESEAGAEPLAQASSEAPPEAGASILERALVPATDQARVAEPPGQPAAPGEALAVPLPIRPAELPPRPRPWHPRTWWQALRGRAAFHPLFSEDFIAPLSVRRVRRWVSRHGVGLRPLDVGAAQRLVMLDANRRRPGDEAVEVDLHVITAAIGHDDTRHRLLLAPDGTVLGRRHWSRPRLAAASGALASLVGLAVGGWHAVGDHLGSTGLALKAPAAALQASATAASAPASAALALAHAGPVAPAAGSAVPPLAPASAASAPEPVAEAPAVEQAHAPVEAPAPEAPAAPAPAPVAAAAPRDVNPRRGRVELPTLAPRLDAAERHEARTTSRALRQATGAAQEARAWALVTQPSADRRRSERVAAQLQAIALLQSVPMRAELMPAGDGWRAVFWPFHSADDAEKARLALADKGLRTELVEF